MHQRFDEFDKFTKGKSFKEAMLFFVKWRGDHVSFVEMKSFLRGFDGDCALIFEGREDLVLWTNISMEACDAISELVKEGLLHYELTSPLLYMGDGGGLRLPIVDDVKRVTKKKKWVPSFVCLGPHPGVAEVKRRMTALPMMFGEQVF